MQCKSQDEEKERMHKGKENDLGKWKVQKMSPNRLTLLSTILKQAGFFNTRGHERKE